MKMPKSAGGWISLSFKLLGATVAAGPAIVAVSSGLTANDPASIPRNVLYNYTGFSATAGNLNFTQLGIGVGSIVGGVVLAKVGTVLGKVFH